MPSMAAMIVGTNSSLQMLGRLLVEAGRMRWAMDGVRFASGELQEDLSAE